MRTRHNYHNERLQAILSDTQTTISLTNTSVLEDLKDKSELSNLLDVTIDKTQMSKARDWQPLSIDIKDLACLLG